MAGAVAGAVTGAAADAVAEAEVLKSRITHGLSFRKRSGKIHERYPFHLTQTLRMQMQWRSGQ